MEDISRAAQIIHSKIRSSDRLIPHRTNKKGSTNFDRKDLILAPDHQGTITSPYEMGSGNMNQANMNHGNTSTGESQNNTPQQACD